MSIGLLMLGSRLALFLPAALLLACCSSCGSVPHIPFKQTQERSISGSLPGVLFIPSHTRAHSLLIPCTVLTAFQSRPSRGWLGQSHHLSGFHFSLHWTLADGSSVSDWIGVVTDQGALSPNPAFRVSRRGICSSSNSIRVLKNAIHGKSESCEHPFPRESDLSDLAKFSGRWERWLFLLPPRGERRPSQTGSVRLPQHPSACVGAPSPQQRTIVCSHNAQSFERWFPFCLWVGFASSRERDRIGTPSGVGCVPHAHAHCPFGSARDWIGLFFGLQFVSQQQRQDLSGRIPQTLGVWCVHQQHTIIIHSKPTGRISSTLLGPGLGPFLVCSPSLCSSSRSNSTAGSFGSPPPTHSLGVLHATSTPEGGHSHRLDRHRPGGSCQPP